MLDPVPHLARAGMTDAQWRAYHAAREKFLDLAFVRISARHEAEDHVGDFLTVTAQWNHTVSYSCCRVPFDLQSYEWMIDGMVQHLAVRLRREFLQHARQDILDAWAKRGIVSHISVNLPTL